MIYLDSAATSMMKPEKVQYAVLSAINNMGSPGRGSHEASRKAAEICYDCRENISRLFNVSAPENIIFTSNATHSLNIAISSVVKKGSRVMISGYEHNSVTRPLNAIGCDIAVINTDLFDTATFLGSVKRNISSVDAVVMTHASNVFGYILPIRDVANICRKYGKPLIIDASQSAGVINIDAAELDAAFIAMPGHKGLMGPQGTGVLICGGDAAPLLYGGSGSDSVLQTMPDYMPDRLEAGTHNVCGIAGLNEGVKYILKYGTEYIKNKERTLLERFVRKIRKNIYLRSFFSDNPELQSGVISLVPQTISCEQLGEKLSEANIAVRTGLHCAPLAHKTAGTFATGTVRFSFSPFNSEDEIDTVAEIIEKIVY